jgi:hypothetical protein
MPRLSTHHSMPGDSGRERVLPDEEAGRLRSDARTTRIAPEGALFRASREWPPCAGTYS